MLIKSAIVLALAYAGILAVISAKQDSLIYYPTSEITANPSAIGLAYEDVSLHTRDEVTITAWYIPRAQSRATLLFCHGNGGNISHRLESIRIFHELDLSVFIFDYRGYGRSSGKPSEEGTYADAEAAFDYLVNERGIDPSHIVIFGRSLGGAVAVETARRRPAAALILESTFTSIPALGATIYPWLPVRLISRYSYDSLSKISELPCPKLLIHSPDDTLVPFDQGQVLYDRAAPPKQFLIIRGNHNDGFIISGETYTEGLKLFLNTYFTQEGR